LHLAGVGIVRDAQYVAAAKARERSHLVVVGPHLPVAAPPQARLVDLPWVGAPAKTAVGVDPHAQYWVAAPGAPRQGLVLPVPFAAGELPAGDGAVAAAYAEPRCDHAAFAVGRRIVVGLIERGKVAGRRIGHLVAHGEVVRHPQVAVARGVGTEPLRADEAVGRGNEALARARNGVMERGAPPGADCL